MGLGGDGDEGLVRPYRQHTLQNHSFDYVNLLHLRVELWLFNFEPSALFFHPTPASLYLSFASNIIIVHG
jgi:hypothetical protein